MRKHFIIMFLLGVFLLECTCSHPLPTNGQVKDCFIRGLPKYFGHTPTWVNKLNRDNILVLEKTIPSSNRNIVIARVYAGENYYIVMMKWENGDWRDGLVCGESLWKSLEFRRRYLDDETR